MTQEKTISAISFPQKTLEATSVIALDQLEIRHRRFRMKRHLRLEDIPASQILKFEQPEAPPEVGGESPSMYYVKHRRLLNKPPPNALNQPLVLQMVVI